MRYFLVCLPWQFWYKDTIITVIWKNLCLFRNCFLSKPGGRLLYSATVFGGGDTMADALDGTTCGWVVACWALPVGVEACCRWMLDVVERSVAVTGDRGAIGIVSAVTGAVMMGDMEQPVGGLIRFSFWRRLQNQTLTTSFSMLSDSASIEISSEVGFGFCKKAFSKASRTVVSMLVRFFRRRPMDSGVVWALVSDEWGLLSEASASSSQRCSSGFSLHIFLKLRLRASNREMVVWLKSLPYSLPIAKPTSPWVKPGRDEKYVS